MKIKLEDLMKLINDSGVKIIIQNQNVYFSNTGAKYERYIHDYGALEIKEITIDPALIVITLEDNTDGIGD